MTAPARWLSTAEQAAWRGYRQMRRLLDAQLAELRGERTVLVSTHDPERVAPLATQQLALA